MTQGNTDAQYDAVLDDCRQIFMKKTRDYGTSWRVYRSISVADQIYIKARRIRNIQEGAVQKIEDSVSDEFKGVVNYAIIGLIQSELKETENEDLPPGEAEGYYLGKVAEAKKLMHDKNHDYGEAWRDMSQEGLTDLILAKILRIKEIIKNKGQTIVSEGIDANFFDILNYAIFALILIQED